MYSFTPCPFCKSEGLLDEKGASYVWSLGRLSDGAARRARLSASDRGRRATIFIDGSYGLVGLNDCPRFGAARRRGVVGGRG